jgi:outer membrane protein OmpA-like peptidoglycan-associated protein
MFGIYGRYSDDDIEQGENSAEGMKTGAGVYGGLIKEKWELKGLLLGSYDNFNTERYIRFMDRKAKADIDAFTLSADIEGALKIALSKYTAFRPYVGFEIADAMYGDFKEKGADALNLYVKSGSYLRSSARGGISVVYDDKYRWGGYAGIEAKYLVSGAAPEIESVFAGTDAEFRSRGSEEGRLEGGVGIGGSVRIYRELKFFVNGNYYAAPRYQNIYGNAGLRYTFCGMKKKDFEGVKKQKDREEFEKFCRVHQDFIDECVDERIKSMEAAKRADAGKAAAESSVKSESSVKTETVVAQAQGKAKHFSGQLVKDSVIKVYFAPGKHAYIGDETKQSIDKALAEAGPIEYAEVIIIGRTDMTGGAQFNQELSEKRAENVYNYVLSKKPEIKTIRYFGIGKELKNPSNEAVAMSEDRRVDIYIVYPQEK